MMLCGGTDRLRLLPLKPTSARRVMVFAAVSCQTCAVPPCWKLARLIVAGVLRRQVLVDDHHRQRAVRRRCGRERGHVSGLGVVAATLVSPNVDLLPS